MPTREDSGQQPGLPQPDAEPADTVSLVDLFDEMDRNAFQRALRHRDNAEPRHSDH